MQIARSAPTNVSYSGVPSRISGFSARPLAITVMVSFVEVSPSMLTMLKDSATTERSALSRTGAAIAASVVRKQSMVHMFG